jgi:hypothetical protein
MPRRKSQIAAVAIMIVGAFGVKAQAAPCAGLLTTSDVSTALGSSVTAQDNGGVPYECIFTSNSTGFQGETPTVTLIVHGGRSDFDQSVNMGAQYGMTDSPLSGVGDKAYLNSHCGEQCAEVEVMKGKTYFTVMVQEDPNHSQAAVALARKVAARIR